MGEPEYAKRLREESRARPLLELVEETIRGAQGDDYDGGFTTRGATEQEVREEVVKERLAALESKNRDLRRKLDTARKQLEWNRDKRDRLRAECEELRKTVERMDDFIKKEEKDHDNGNGWRLIRPDELRRVFGTPLRAAASGSPQKDRAGGEDVCMICRRPAPKIRTHTDGIEVYEEVRKCPFCGSLKFKPAASKSSKEERGEK